MNSEYLRVCNLRKILNQKQDILSNCLREEGKKKQNERNLKAYVDIGLSRELLDSMASERGGEQ